MFIDNRFLQEVLKFQGYVGINASFGFTTGMTMNQRMNADVKLIQPRPSVQPETITTNVYQNADLRDSMSSDIKYLQHITSLEELIIAINNFNGCSLKRHAKHTVIYDGNLHANVMLIGEAPGENEDKEGRPFCGQSGNLLRQALEYIGLTTDNLLFTNMVYWRPPDNRKPTPQELQTCLPFVMKMLDIVKPKLVILSGATAIEGILQQHNVKISNIIGSLQHKNLEIQKGEVRTLKCFPIYHPAFVLRQPSMKKILWQHLLKLKNYLSKE